MLCDSLAEEFAGHHVEQVEIVFASGSWRERVAAAWAETVVRTEALRIAFSFENGEPVGIECASPPLPLRLEEAPPVLWNAWLAKDRRRPFLTPQQVPWRAVYWPQDGRFLWTFHHALLDGRSITRILQCFLQRVSGTPAECLGLSSWRSPTSSALALAERMFREDVPPQPERSLPCMADDGPAVHCLGAEFLNQLAMVALVLESTVATLLIWAWGQALATATGTEAVIVEQVRSGAPQEGRAGFTMLTLPVFISRAAAGSEEKALREFRKHLLRLREIEGVSPSDFPPGVHPGTDRAGSSVIMVEHATPEHLLSSAILRSVVLHEARGETLMATAHLLPDLRLEVEGPGRQIMLEGWLRVLMGFGLPACMDSGLPEADM